MRFFVLLVLLLSSLVYSSNCIPDIEWSHVFDDDVPEDDFISVSEAYSVTSTYAGGYAVAGATRETLVDYIAWVRKLDAAGNLEWQRNFTSEYVIYLRSIVETNEGDLVVAGNTYLPEKESEILLIKMDSEGNVKWTKNYGRADYDDGANSVIITSDGSYVLAGWTGTEETNYDNWVVKTDSDGNLQWNASFGGHSGEEAYSVQQTKDGGYIVGGEDNSIGAGGYDVWVIKLDSEGNAEWNRTYGTYAEDDAWSIQQTEDLGYIIAGYTDSYEGPGLALNAWFIKTDPEGNSEWERIIETGWFSEAHSILQVSDGGYLAVGESNTQVELNEYQGYAWLVKLTADGNVEWIKNLTTSEDGAAYEIQRTLDGGYVVAGHSSPSYGGHHYSWVAKLSSCEVQESEPVMAEESVGADELESETDKTAPSDMLCNGALAVLSIAFAGLVLYGPK